VARPLGRKRFFIVIVAAPLLVSIVIVTRLEEFGWWNFGDVGLCQVIFETL
jgi:hypothetical protein